MAPCPAVLVFETVSGSTAFNLDRVGSDIDIRGIIVGPAVWYHGFAPAPEQVEHSPDHVHFEIRKFFRLAAAANPTMLEMIWSDPRHHRTVNGGGALLLESRHLFLSRRVSEAFAGYAQAQLARMRNHRQWLLDPPRRPPTRDDFGLPAERKAGPDQARAADALEAREGWQLAPAFQDLLQRERRYRAAVTRFAQYEQWLRSRNPARAELERRYGYDTKHAMHLVRLQRMALEVLVDGELRVWRDDRDELLAIRDGAWTYDELMSQCDRLAEGMRQAREVSPLPVAPDLDGLSELCCRIVEASLSSTT